MKSVIFLSTLMAILLFTGCAEDATAVKSDIHNVVGSFKKGR